MSDRRSTAADVTQTQQSEHYHRENNNASLILKRKTLRSKREGSIFFHMWQILVFQCISIQDALSDFCSFDTILSQFNPLVVYNVEILFPAEPPDHEKSLCVTLLKSQQLLQSAALYTHRNTWRTWHQKWHWRKYLRKPIIYSIL